MASVSTFFAVGFDLTTSLGRGDTFVPEKQNWRLNRISGEFQQVVTGLFVTAG